MLDVTSSDLNSGRCFFGNIRPNFIIPGRLSSFPITALPSREFAERFLAAPTELSGAEVQIQLKNKPRATTSTLKAVEPMGEYAYDLVLGDGDAALQEIRVCSCDVEYVVILSRPKMGAAARLPHHAACRTRQMRRDDLDLTKPSVSEYQGGDLFRARKEALNSFLEETATLPPVEDPQVLAELNQHFFGYRLDASQIDPEVGLIKIYRSRFRWDKFTEPEDPHRPPEIVQISGDNFTCYLDQSETLANHAKNSLLSLLNGNELEVDYSSRIEKPVPAGYWSMRDEDELAMYASQIRPCVAEIVSKVVLSKYCLGRQRILDLLGGDGVLLEDLGRLVSGKANAKVDLQYHLIDNNESELNQARERFSAQGIPVQIHNFDFLRFPFLQLAGLSQLSIVTCVGGLTAGVCDKEIARIVSANVFENLERGGYFVLTGYTPLRLNADDFARIGYQVVNKSDPSRVLVKEAGQELPEQLYVLRKPG